MRGERFPPFNTFSARFWLALATASPVASLCRVVEPHAVTDVRLRVLVREAHERAHGRYGRPRVHRALRKQGIRVSGKRIGRLMREEGLVGRLRRRFRCTTMSEHDERLHSSLDDASPAQFERELIVRGAA